MWTERRHTVHGLSPGAALMGDSLGGSGGPRSMRPGRAPIRGAEPPRKQGTLKRVTMWPMFFRGCSQYLLHVASEFPVFSGRCH